MKAVLQLWSINVTCCYGQGNTSVCGPSMLHVVMVKAVLHLQLSMLYVVMIKVILQFVVHQCYMLLWSRRYFSCGSLMLHVVIVKAVLQLLFLNVTCCYGQGGTSVAVHQYCMLVLWSRR